MEGGFVSWRSPLPARGLDALRDPLEDIAEAIVGQDVHIRWVHGRSGRCRELLREPPGGARRGARAREAVARWKQRAEDQRLRELGPDPGVRRPPELLCQRQG